MQSIDASPYRKLHEPGIYRPLIIHIRAKDRMISADIGEGTDRVDLSAVPLKVLFRFRAQPGLSCPADEVVYRPCLGRRAQVATIGGRKERSGETGVRTIGLVIAAALLIGLSAPAMARSDEAAWQVSEKTLGCAKQALLNRVYPPGPIAGYVNLIIRDAALDAGDCRYFEPGDRLGVRALGGAASEVVLLPGNGPTYFVRSATLHPVETPTRPERTAASSQRAGYRAMTVKDFVLDGEDLAAAGATVALRGAYTKPHAVPYLFVGSFDNPVKVTLLLDAATRETRGRLLNCQEHPLGYGGLNGCASITLFGHATICEIALAQGLKKEEPCLDVLDSDLPPPSP